MLLLDSENLILNPVAQRALKNARLGRLKDLFRVYYGMIGSTEISSLLALQQAGASAQANETQVAGAGAPGARLPTNRQSIQAAQRDLEVRADPALVPIFNILLDSDASAARRILSGGSSTQPEEDTTSIKYQLNNAANGGSSESEVQASNARNIARCVKLHYCIENRSSDDQLLLNAGPNRVYFNDLDKAVPVLEGEETATFKQRIAVARMEHPLLVPGEKNAELLSVFFNGMPTLEMTRATPVLNIKLFSTRATIEDNRLSGITLQKFVEGAKSLGEANEQNLPERAFALASQVPKNNVPGQQQRPAAREFDSFTVTGLELFRAPQTLQNIDATKNTENYLAPVIDPLRPLASIKSFAVDVKSAYGIQGTRTATLDIVLHDRSRMSEFADFVKPDRFGETFLEVEYGWSHPDREDNPYADLLNLTRSVEHYTIMTSNFSFDDVGQVNITLNLIGRGAAESTELSIVGDRASTRIQTKIRDIQRLCETVNRLSGLVFRPPPENQTGRSTHVREIRGLQGLSAAGDATSSLVLSREMLADLRALQATLNSQTRPGTNSTLRANSAQLREAVNGLIGTQSGTTATGPAGVISGVSQALSQEMREILGRVNSGVPPTKGNFYNDSFLSGMTVWDKIKDALDTTVHARPPEASAAPTEQLPTVNNNAARAGGGAGGTVESFGGAKVVSLGTLMTAFVAKPLAALMNTDNTPKFDEVQLWFYNFNNKASHMSHCNISQFPVQTEYFVREYGRLRMENVSRTANLSVNEFMNFVASKIVDDVMNPAFGINSLYTYGRDQELVVETRQRNNFDQTMYTKMTANNIGHHPDFVPPQVTFDIEAIPSVAAINGPIKTILKIHVYDKACSPNNPYRELLTLGTNNILGTMSAYPGTASQASANVAAAQQQDTTQNASVLRENWSSLHNRVLAAAGPVDQGGIGLITGAPAVTRNGISIPQHRFVGGAQQLKQFAMKGIPHIIYGAMGTTIRSATISSMSDAALNTINLQRSLNASPLLPNGQQAGGVPLSVYPVELSMTSLGCPILRYGQEMFIDYNTNTSIDNIYYITGLQHKIEAGTFESTIKFTCVDAFGRYQSLVGQLNTASETLAEMGRTPSSTQPPTSTPTATPGQTPHQRRRAAHNHHTAAHGAGTTTTTTRSTVASGGARLEE